MKLRGALILPLLLTLFLAGCKDNVTPDAAGAGPTPVADGKVPNLVGLRVSDARALLTGDGFESILQVDATGRNRPILEPDNWIVRSQSPGAGVTVAKSSRITLNASKPTDGQGSTTAEGGVIPNLVCKDLQAAQDLLQDAGYFNVRTQDGTGQRRQQVLDRNWVVTAQTPKAGEKPGKLTEIMLTAVKIGEDTGAANCPR